MKSFISIRDVVIFLILVMILAVSLIILPPIYIGSVIGWEYAALFLSVLIPSFLLSNSGNSKKSELFTKMAISSLLISMVIMIINIADHQFYLMRAYHTYGADYSNALFVNAYLYFFTNLQNLFILALPALLTGGLAGCNKFVESVNESYLKVMNKEAIENLDIRVDANSSVQSAIKTLDSAQAHADKYNHAFLHESDQQDMYLNQ